MTDRDPLRTHTERLLERDVSVHREAIAELADCGDERVVPHLLEVELIDAIANDWDSFGFPEVLRERRPPRYLELPETAWPGVEDALTAITGTEFDSEFAWVEWESWYSQQDIDPLDGFDEWKLQLYRSFLPPVGSLLDTTPRAFDLQDIRWGNCDRSFLAALNGPDFVPGKAVTVEAATEAATGPRRYLSDDQVVFGFRLGGRAYAVPRQVIFPHEMLNAEIDGVPLSLTYCTLCNAPILYEVTVDNRPLTFGSTGMLLGGNKVMFDEETESLWSQHRGVPIAGEFFERDVSLDVRAVTQTEWGAWFEEHPDTLTLDIDTDYDFDYSYYDGHLGIFEHYWQSEDAIQPGLQTAESELPEKMSVYGVPGNDQGTVHVFPVEVVERETTIVHDIGDEPVVATIDPTGDVAVYFAPPLPVEEDGEELVDADGNRWHVGVDGLRRADGTASRDRIAGRHGLWFAFRTGYESPVVVTAD
jgi:hypothetical protein